MDGKLALPLAFLCVQSRHTHLLAQVSSLVVLHTPISKVLGNSHSVVARSCGALVAVATELLSQQEASPHHPKFPLQTTVLFPSHNSHLCNSSHLVGEDEGNLELVAPKKREV